MTNRTRASIMKNFNAEVSLLIAESRGISEMDGLRLFLASETHSMLEDNDLRM